MKNMDSKKIFLILGLGFLLAFVGIGSAGADYWTHCHTSGYCAYCPTTSGSCVRDDTTCMNGWCSSCFYSTWHPGGYYCIALDGSKPCNYDVTECDGSCTSTGCPSCSVNCSNYSNYPNTSCDTTNGGTCTRSWKTCSSTDNCGDSCTGGGRYCYSNPTCSSSCGSCSAGIYFSSAPAHSYVSGSRKCIRTDCTDYYQNCYNCYTGCRDGGTYYSSQPANVSIINKYYYSNCSTVNRCYTCNTGCHSGGTYYSSQPANVNNIYSYTYSNCSTANRCYTCNAGCNSGGTYYSSQPANVNNIYSYTYSNCTTANRCYTCNVGCNSGGTYYSSQPANVNNTYPYTYSNCTTTNRCYTCNTGCHSGGTYYSSDPSISTEITNRYPYTYSNCTTSNKCLTCRSGCGACNDGGIYSSTQPANTYIPGQCSYTNNNCTTQNEYCYQPCPDVTCADLPSNLGSGAWLDTCPVGEDCFSTYRSVPIPIPTSPAPMGGTAYNCSRDEIKTCYYPNSNPDVLSVIAIDGDFSQVGFPKDYVLGYTSTEYTGKELNNPVRVQGIYSDDDGSNDIMALYVWWSPETSKVFTTPTEADIENLLNGRTANNSNFGLMISRDYGSPNWNASGVYRVYIPDLQGSPGSWTQIGNTGSTGLAIKSSTGNDYIDIHNFNITINSDDEVVLNMFMYYRNEDDSALDVVPKDRYRLWGSVNDRVGFLPFNVAYYQSHYPNDPYHIVDSGNDAWQHTSNDWNLDMIEPGGVISTVQDSNPSEVTVTVNADDNDSIAYVRLDACKGGYDAAQELTYLDTDSTWKSYPMSDCADVLTPTGFPIANMTGGDSLLGYRGGYSDGTGYHEINNPLFNNQQAVVNLGANIEGSITFYLTVMDMSGNNNADNQDTYVYRLEQWAIVEDGMVFGDTGVHSSTRLLDNSLSLYTAHTVLDRLREKQYPDLTNQALLGNSADLSFGLGVLERTDYNKAFKVTNFPGILMSSVYTELTEAYERKSTNSSFDEKIIPTGTVSISGSISNPGLVSGEVCTQDYCIWTWSPDVSDPLQPLTINSGFVCDKKGLIIANGNVDINPSFTNATASDSCIILANGNITINEGASGVGTPSYDIVESFLIASGYIEILGAGAAIPDDDGLFVEGGLAGFTMNGKNTAVYNNRQLRYDVMNEYPVLVVKGNSKYGLLSRTLFGSQIDIFKSELGFKPY